MTAPQTVAASAADRLHQLNSISNSRADGEMELIAACLTGDPAAERMLYEAHVAALYRCALRLCGDPDTAEDITQEAFVRAFDRLGQYRGDSALRTWLIAIAVSAGGMLLRKGRWLRHRLEPLDDQMATNAAVGPDADVAQHIDAAVAALSEKLRLVFVMHDVEGFTHEEIAVTLRIPAGTSRARLSDARAKLRTALTHHRKDWLP